MGHFPAMSEHEIERFADWSVRLNAFVESRRHAAHLYGANDCGLFAADAIEAFAGVDLIADIRGTWSNEAEANAVIESLGGWEQLLEARLGRPVGVRQARRGDVVLGELREGVEGIAIWIGDRAVVPGARHNIRERQIVREPGLVFLKRERFRLAWRVG